MITPAFQIGDCVRIMSIRGRELSSHHIARLEHDAHDNFWAGFVHRADQPGLPYFYVPIERVRASGAISPG